jgi:hypothetical protein
VDTTNLWSRPIDAGRENCARRRAGRILPRVPGAWAAQLAQARMIALTMLNAIRRGGDKARRLRSRTGDQLRGRRGHRRVHRREYQGV